MVIPLKGKSETWCGSFMCIDQMFYMIMNENYKYFGVSNKRNRLHVDHN